MKILDYLDSHLIVFLNAKSRNEALKTLVDLLKKNNKIKENEIFYKAILERERLSSTGIGMGVALPHAKRDNFSDFFIAVGIQQNQGIPWNSIDKLPVYLIFLIGGPSNKPREYLQLLSQLTNVLKSDEFLKKLMHTKSAEDFLKIFKAGI